MTIFRFPSPRAPFRPRRLLAAGLVVTALALAGCSGTAAGPSTVDAEAGATGQWIVSRDLEPGMGSPEPDGVFPREVTHFAGTTEIASKPQRIAVVSTGQLDALLSLGQVPVAATRAENSGLVPQYLREALPDKTAALDAMSDIGERTEPDLEAIAQAAPDLILINSTRGAQLYDALSAIAPTVVTKGNGVNWKSDLLLIADALGDEGAARGVLDELQAESAAFAQTHPAGEPTVSFLQSTGDRTRIMGLPSFAGGIAEDLGLGRPASQQFDETSKEISAEQIDLADADRVYYGGTEQGRAFIEQAPLWPTLGAVEDQRTTAVDFDPWFMNAGPIAARLVQDEIIRTVGGS
ncbi:iron-siderophore ABC transporter substrate-binding protein [Microbacterium testaceum]|uniref:iron-siderophore ABC transporter substrate-binding protein n=1 Tax=Microbacterium testaceum TaxID=2033 RepID=UPI002AC401D8|nr:iron-siderophore ABC transporter substrate-binding protein [Microbacterium testaceum]MDZ5144531.1 iron-siderophore ABC transporter substrate-binding protein [Microbacterium testaceum]